MSHIRVKMQYNTEGSYGSTEKRTLYAHHNLSCDYTTFYDDDGSFLFTFPDTMDGNLLDAIKSLASPMVSASGRDLNAGISYMDLDDQKKCGIL